MIRELLVRGIAAAHAGDTEEARRYLERVLNLPASTLNQRAQAHLWLSRLTDDPRIKREHLEYVLAAQPMHGEARRELAILDGRLEPQDIVDPDHVADPDRASGPKEGRPVVTRRVICPQCGGTLHFEPGTAWVTCQYCGHRQPIAAALRHQAPLEEADFVVALATRRWHHSPEGLRQFRCQGCQATLIASGAITARCPYCGSSHIVEIPTDEMIPPEGIIPFQIDARTAQRRFREWLRQRIDDQHVRTTRVRGLYLPIWTFDVMGDVGWRQMQPKDEEGLSRFALPLGGGNAYGGRKRTPGEPTEGSYPVLLNDIVVPATHQIAYALHEVFDRFDLEEVLPYDTAFLSDWPAETYDVPVSRASLVARQHALAAARQQVEAQQTAFGEDAQSLVVFPQTLPVDTYKLIYVPVWLANYHYEKRTYTVAISGQTEDIVGEQPSGWLKRPARGPLHGA